MTTKEPTLRRRAMWVGIGVALLVPTPWADHARRYSPGALELAAPAAAQAVRGRSSTQQPPLLSKQEVQAGLAMRLQRMRMRQDVRQARQSVEQRQLSPQQGARILGRQPAPRDPAPIPPDLLRDVEQ